MTRQRRRPGAVKLAATAATITIVSGLAACGGESPPVRAPAADPAAVAVVTGDANSPAAIETRTIESLLDRAFDHNAGFAVVDAGGRPHLFATTLGGTFGNSDAENAARAEQVPAAIHALDKVIPATGESDPWTAVSEAIGWLHDQGGGTLVVENSGLGTTGFLNYRQAGLLEADPAELVAFARAHHELPDAAGIKVILLGVGWTALPQLALGAPERSNLAGQWAALLTAAGAQVSIDQTPLTGSAPASAPKVSLVTTTDVSWKPPSGTCGTAFNATELHFIVGTAQLRDPAAAATVVRNVVAELKASRRVATITGTTSSEGGPAINVPLSKERALATAQLMESMGLPGSQIGQVIGLGSHFPGYVPDIGPGGVLLPGPAAENRQVIISWPCAAPGNNKKQQLVQRGRPPGPVLDRPELTRGRHVIDDDRSHDHYPDMHAVRVSSRGDHTCDPVLLLLGHKLRLRSGPKPRQAEPGGRQGAGNPACGFPRARAQLSARKVFAEFLRKTEGSPGFFPITRSTAFSRAAAHDSEEIRMADSERLHLESHDDGSGDRDYAALLNPALFEAVDSAQQPDSALDALLREIAPVAGRDSAEARARQIDIDRRMVERVAAENFDGPNTKKLLLAAYGYAYPVVAHLIRTGQIFNECLRLGRPVKRQPGDELWTDDDRTYLTESCVDAGIFHVFYEHGLKNRRWDPRRGTALTTYGVNACSLCFSSIYPKWRRRRVLEHSFGDLEVDLPAHVRLDLHQPDPAERVVNRLYAEQLLLKMPEPARTALWLRGMQDATQAEAAAHVGLTEKALESQIGRARAKLGLGRPSSPKAGQDRVPAPELEAQLDSTQEGDCDLQG